MILRVAEVKLMDRYRLWLRFNDGAKGVVDLEPELYGEVFLPLRDPALFRRVFLTSRHHRMAERRGFRAEFLREQLQQTVSAL